MWRGRGATEERRGGSGFYRTVILCGKVWCVFFPVAFIFFVLPSPSSLSPSFSVILPPSFHPPPSTPFSSLLLLWALWETRVHLVCLLLSLLSKPLLFCVCLSPSLPPPPFCHHSNLPIPSVQHRPCLLSATVLTLSLPIFSRSPFHRSSTLPSFLPSTTFRRCPFHQVTATLPSTITTTTATLPCLLFTKLSPSSLKVTGGVKPRGS